MSENKQQLIQCLKEEGISDEAVLKAIECTPRELFVLPEYQEMAYTNTALPIESKQTISQPYIVARMTEALHSSGAMDQILEIGTGSGYQTAILAYLAKAVYSVERIESLYQLAQKRLAQLKIHNVMMLHGDGYQGWPEYAPYDGILVTAAAKGIPENLLGQLKEGGRLVIPVGEFDTQELLLITRRGEKLAKKVLGFVRFVPFLPGKTN